ncbi:hypothetical protein B0H12DRAFT_1231059 [Mycena haematopus]|nr:hypothetical protein B0H12DRAFT_1231059 [Mycena haematopus]
MVEPVTAIAAGVEVVGLTVKSVHWVKEKLPAQKTKEGYAQLHNGFLLLVSDFDRLLPKVRNQLLDTFDRLFDAYDGHNPKDLKFFRSLKNGTILGNIAFANEFFHQSIDFNEAVHVAFFPIFRSKSDRRTTEIVD